MSTPQKKRAGAAHRPGPKYLKGSDTKPQGELSGRAAPKDIPQQFRSVPNEMREARRWLLWAFDAQGNKRPARLEWTKPRTWLTLDAALKRRRPKQHLGFVLGDGWAGIDVDGAWSDASADDSRDTMREHARHVWDACKGAYVERSPSGTGFKVFLRLDDDAPECQAQQALPGKHVGTEAYQKRGRWFAVTGDSMTGSGGDVSDAAAREGWRVVCAQLRAGRTSRRRKTRHGDGDPDELADIDRLYSYTPEREQELREALATVASDCSYNDWTRIGLALQGMGWSGEYSERAFDLWHEWSQRGGDKYPGEDECRDRWGKLHARGDVTVATIFDAARKNGWRKATARTVSKSAERNARTLLTRTTDTVENRAVRWLWPGRIAQGYLNLVVGETGAAKSTMLMDVAARVTRGDPFPGEASDLDELLERTPGRVLLLGTEDGVAELIGPRLKAAGADESLTIEIYGVTHDGTRDLFSMQDDIDAMRKLVKQYSHTQAPVRMLIIDPITAYLSGQKVRKVDLADNGQLRAILTPWLELAQETGIAIVCITHMAKDTARQVLHRVLGAGVFTHTARSVLVVVKLEAESEGEYAKAVLQVKGNLPETVKPGAQRFRTEVVETGRDARTGQPITASRVRWEGIDPTLTVASLAGGSRGPVSDFGPELRGWLRGRFAREHDLQPVESVRREATDAIGFSDSWWDKHSAAYLEKRNVGGKWMCRPRTY